MRLLRFVPAVVLATSCAASTFAQPLLIPDDFPRFVVPGQDKAMASLRDLYYRHYQPPAGPLATMWDEWMSAPTLWPAVETGNRSAGLRAAWAKTLSNRHIDADGYVSTHQHASIAHQHGWPFPFWAQGGPGTWGWHFSLQHVPQGWHGTQEKKQDGWEIVGGKDPGIAEFAWNVELTKPDAAVRTPPLEIDPEQSPFIQLRWRAEGLENAQPYIEWGEGDSGSTIPPRRFYFPPITKAQGIVYTMIPVYQSPLWKGKITRLGINFGNTGPAKVGIQALFTQYDTRHNINNSCFTRGCCQYFWWTGDLNFLRDNLQRMRLAVRYMMTDFGAAKEKCIVTPFPGHDGRPGYDVATDGKKTMHSGHGIGHNYWDLLPCGYRDGYATMQYYSTLNYMSRLETEIARHPEWNLPAGPLRLDAKDLTEHAREVKQYAGQLFWNKDTGRFVTGLDGDGKMHDYGYTFMNCEAIHYDFATPEQARSIMDWLTGKRIVEGDTSKGADIYHWRFGPRASTKRNVEWYFWAWTGPETIPWGGQVQDGGAVLGFSYHDLMARLKVIGPDDAWQRLKETLAWYDEVQAAGGYREYYKDGTRGTMQGGGTAGGLGLDKEFFESILVPQIVVDGFLGLRARGDGLEIKPRLPSDWPEVTVTRVALRQLVLDISVKKDRIRISGLGRAPSLLFVYPPPAKWKATVTDKNGKQVREMYNVIEGPDDRVELDVADGRTLTLELD